MSRNEDGSGNTGNSTTQTEISRDVTRIHGEKILSFQYPMLSKTNYAVWAIKMEVFLTAQGVWEVIEGTPPVDSREDKIALAAIYQAIGEDILMQLGAKKTAKEAWDMIKMMNEGAERIKQVRVQTLLREFESLKLQETESIDEFTSKMNINVSKLRSLGHKMEEEYVVKKLLRSTSSKFIQIATTMEEFCDLKVKSIDEVIGSLKAHEERVQDFGEKNLESALLTRAEWKAREKKKGKGKASKEKEDSQSDDEEHKSKKSFDKRKIKCWSCGNMGHLKSECDAKDKDEEVNLVMKGDEEEPTLLMMVKHDESHQEGLIQSHEKGIKTRLD